MAVELVRKWKVSQHYYFIIISTCLVLEWQYLKSTVGRESGVSLWGILAMAKHNCCLKGTDDLVCISVVFGSGLQNQLCSDQGYNVTLKFR